MKDSWLKDICLSFAVGVSIGHGMTIAIPKIRTDAEGHLSIGHTNIFQGMDIGITRVYMWGETSKAWVNVAQVDDWPGWTRAGEWWVNTGINDCKMVLTWLDTNGNSRSIVQSAGPEAHQHYVALQVDHQDVIRLTGDGDLIVSGNVYVGGIITSEKGN